MADLAGWWFDAKRKEVVIVMYRFSAKQVLKVVWVAKEIKPKETLDGKRSIP